MQKFLKKITKYLFHGFLGLFVLILLIYLMIQTPFVKNWTRNYINKQVSKNIAGDFNIAKLRGDLFTKIKLADVTIVSRRDTVLYVPYFQIDYEILKLVRRKIIVNSLSIQSPNIKVDKLRNLFQSKPQKQTDSIRQATSSGSFKYVIEAQNILVDSGHINLPDINDKIPQQLDNVNLKANFNYNGESLNFILEKLNMVTKEPEYGIEQVAFNFEKEGEVLKLDNLVFESMQNQLNGQIKYSAPDFLTAEINSEPLYPGEFQNLVPGFEPEIDPSISFGIDYQHDSLDFVFTAMADNQKINLEVKATNTGKLLEGKINEKIDYNLKGDLTSISVDQWTGDTSMYYLINSNFNINGLGVSKNALIASGEINVYDSQLMEYAIENINLTGKYKQNDFTGKVVVEGGFGRGQIDGNLAKVWTDRIYDLNLKFNDFNAEVITGNKDYYSDLNLYGVIKGKGFYPQANLQGQISMEKSVIANYLIDTSFTDFKYENQRLQLDSLELKSEAVDLSAAGIYDLENESDLTVTMDVKELAPFQEYIPVDSLDAKGKFNARMQGKMDSLTISADLNLDSVGYQSIETRKVAGKLKINLGQQPIQAEGELSLSQVKNNSLMLDTVNLAANYSDKFADLDLEIWQNENRANLVGSFSHTDAPELIITDLAIDFDGQEWRHVGEDARITILGDSYQVNDFHLIEQTGDRDQEITASGNFSLEGSENFSLEINNFNTSYLNEILSIPAYIQGYLDFNLAIRGTAQQPDIEGEMTIDEGMLNDFAYDSLVGGLNYNKEEFNFAFLLNSAEDDSIRITGKTSFNYSLSEQFDDFDKNTLFRVMVNTDKFPLDIFKSGNLPVKEFKGDGNCDITLSGTINQPEISGNFRIDDGEITAPEYGVNYKDLQLIISLNNKKINLDTLRIKRDGGYFRMSGAVGFQNHILIGDFETIDFKFNTKKFYLSKHNDHQIQISGNGFLTGNLAQPEFGGNLTILRSSINLAAISGQGDQAELQKIESEPLLVRAMKGDSVKADTIQVTQEQEFTLIEEETPEILDKLRGEYKVKIPRNTWIKNENLRTELSGNLNIIKDSPKIKIYGDINVVRGYYDFIGRRFRIEEGQVSFVGNEKINPRLNVSAEYTFRTEAREKKVLKLLIRGNLRQPELNFSMDGQNLNEGDAVAYIMFGKSMGELSAGQQEGMESTFGGTSRTEMAKELAANLVTAELSKLLSKELNLDYIEIQSQDQWQSASLIIGKYITNDLFVSYQRGLGTTEDANNLAETVKLEYQLTRIIFLQLIGHTKYSGFDVIFQFQRE